MQAVAIVDHQLMLLTECVNDTGDQFPPMLKITGDHLATVYR
jgi:hypothetical protein